jgi:cytochrome c oxidase subunit 4
VTNGGSNGRRLWRGPLLAWIALLVLFLVSLGSAYIPLGAGNLALNLFIAVVMVILVAVFLMDLQNAKLLVRIVAVAGLYWTMMMFVLTFSDYFTRH